MPGMRSLLAAAVGVVAAFVQSAAAGQQAPQTIYSHAGRIAAFAQDGPQIAWFAPGRKRCNTVHVRSLANGLKVVVPKQDGARNVTCTWDVTSTPVQLALAGGSGSVLWTLHEQSPIPFDYLIGAGVGNGERLERRFQELAHTNRGAGLWLGGVAGDGQTLVYGVTSVDWVDEAGCLAGTGTCELEVVGGGIYRLSGRQRPALVPGTDRAGAIAVAASSGALAYVAAGDVDKAGRPVAGTDTSVDVVDAVTGASIAKIVPQGTPLAVALTPNVVATLERTALGLRVAWYDRTKGSAAGGGSVPVSGKTAPELTASDTTIVYRVGRVIHAIDLASRNVTTLARAASPPIGLSLEGRRLAWAENLRSSARIRALSLKR